MPRAAARRQQIVQSFSLPAPIDGLNARDSISLMKETDALLLDNLFPGTTSVDLRKGRASFATFTGSCQTIILYNGTSKVFVGVYDGSDYEIMNATAGGAISTAVVGGSGDTVEALSNARFDYQNFGTTGGQYLVAVNGADVPLQYDGTNWTASTMTGSGLTPADLFTVAVYAERLWFAETGTFNVWYLPTQSITGTLTKLNLGSIFQLGGALSNIVTCSANSGSLLADFICFISTEGEVVVYSGDDPTSITTWARYAQFRIGKPVTTGNRAWCKIGSEAVVVTADGVVPIAAAITQDRNQATAISDRIRNSFNADVVTHGSKFGWAAVLHPTGQKFLVNVPTDTLSTAYQWVMNTQTRRWCRFTGWDAFCMAATRDTLYYGGSGHLSKADTGLNDDGSPILAAARQAFSYFKRRGRQKFVTMIRPTLTLDGPVNLKLSVDTDFRDVDPQSTIALSGSAGDPWETAWDYAWTGAPIVYSQWHSAGGIGFAIAPRIEFQADSINLSWSATDIAFQEGAVL